MEPQFQTEPRALEGGGTSRAAPSEGAAHDVAVGGVAARTVSGERAACVALDIMASWVPAPPAGTGEPGSSAPGLAATAAMRGLPATCASVACSAASAPSAGAGVPVVEGGTAEPRSWRYGKPRALRLAGVAGSGAAGSVAMDSGAAASVPGSRRGGASGAMRACSTSVRLPGVASAGPGTPGVRARSVVDRLPE